MAALHLMAVGVSLVYRGNCACWGVWAVCGGMPATEAFRPLSWSDQGMVVFTAFVAKPLYVATSLWLAWRRRGWGHFFYPPPQGRLSDNRQTTICAPRLT